MSLCALIYSKITKITSVYDMTQIMIAGIQLYFSLSLLARQSMPGMVTVFEQFFHLEYMVITELRGITTVFASDRVQHLRHCWH